MKEKLKESIPSSFIITLNGEERRLNTNERLTLNASADYSRDNPMESLEVFVEPEGYVFFEIVFKNSVRFRPNWGLVKKRFDSDEKVFQSTFSNSAFHEENGLKYITGSFIHFNETETVLKGADWILEYRPL